MEGSGGLLQCCRCVSVPAVAQGFHSDGYRVILHERGLLRPLYNSFITTVVGTLFGLVLCTLGGYVLIQFDMPGRGFLAYFLLVTMIFSGGMIPEYLVMRRLGLIDNMWILVFKHGISVYNIVLMRNFFEGIPSSLYEAARIDGCSPMGIFLRIVLPLFQGCPGFHRPDVRRWRLERLFHGSDLYYLS